MLAALLILPIFGAVIGWFAKYALEIRMSRRGAVALGAVGAVIGGVTAGLIIPIVSGLFGAAVGACGLIWFVERYRNRVF